MKITSWSKSANLDTSHDEANKLRNVQNVSTLTAEYSTQKTRLVYLTLQYLKDRGLLRQEYS